MSLFANFLDRNYSGPMSSSPVFQRAGSGRFSANNSSNYGQTSPSAQHESYSGVLSPQADLTETNDMGSGQSKSIV